MGHDQAWKQSSLGHLALSLLVQRRDALCWNYLKSRSRSACSRSQELLSRTKAESCQELRCVDCVNTAWEWSCRCSRRASSLIGTHLPWTLACPDKGRGHSLYSYRFTSQERSCRCQNQSSSSSLSVESSSRWHSSHWMFPFGCKYRACCPCLEWRSHGDVWQIWEWSFWYRLARRLHAYSCWVADDQNQRALRTQANQRE